jgi:multiple sugar transport system ATP-binding protein
MENVSKVFVGGEGYTQVIAVRNLDLEVQDQELLVMLGPSGAGKTVLLRLIAGLDKMDGGEIYLDGEEISDLQPGQRGVAMVFEDFGLYPHMNVFDNMAFGLRNIRVPEPEIRKRVTEAAGVLRIADLLKRKPKTLSAGQKQRVAIGRAMVKRPRILLMDEPFANLDARLKVEMRNEMKKLHQKLKATIVFVTHDQMDAMSLADRIAVIKEGRIVQIGSPDELYSHPASKFVAGFVGTPPMNFFEGDLVKSGDEIRVSTADFSLPLPKQVQSLVSGKLTANKLFLGFRPEDIVVKSRSDSGGEGHAEARIAFAEPLGSFTFLHLELGHDSAVAISPEGFHGTPGTSVSISFDLGRMHIFDAMTEEAVL